MTKFINLKFANQDFFDRKRNQIKFFVYLYGLTSIKISIYAP